MTEDREHLIKKAYQEGLRVRRERKKKQRRQFLDKIFPVSMTLFGLSVLTSSVYVPIILGAYGVILGVGYGWILIVYGLILGFAGGRLMIDWIQQWATKEKNDS